MAAKTALFPLLALLFTLPFSIPAEAKPRIAVWPLEIGEGIGEGESKLLSEALRVDLVNTGAFEVLERERIEQILREVGMSLSECTDEECALRAGRVLSAEKVVMATVGRVGATYALSARLVDVETGSTDMATPVMKTELKDELLTLCVPGVAACLAFGECEAGTTAEGAPVGQGDLYFKSVPPGADHAGIRRGPGRRTAEGEARGGGVLLVRDHERCEERVENRGHHARDG
jgi:hypothetical protein